MGNLSVREAQFEQDIADSLCTYGGYKKGDGKGFDPALGLDIDTFINFIKTTQPDQWERQLARYGDNEEKAIQETVQRFISLVKSQGLLYVLRNGFVDKGTPLKAVFWKPRTHLNEIANEQYENNVFECVRQLHYSPNNSNSIDIVLFINGIPVVSMELKCQFTGQDTTNAIKQYRFDRAGKETIFAFKQRVLVHFAVDLTKVYMTTKLEGESTFFLPFNQGSNGPGKVGGAGNPINPDGYATAYLWEEVLVKDRLLEILQKYMKVESTTSGDRLIFPRYHQLDVITNLLQNVQAHGAGHNYLIQHSAGSGKSNSIAWLAHRLYDLHDDTDEAIFKSVIIVTDRRVLDSQLQQVVSGIDHTPGLVQKVDKNSQQLKNAIESGTKIIITTLQKFPVIYEELNAGHHRFAIIVDEAHSSQTGDAARKLKQALADTSESLEAYAKIEGLKEEIDDEDRLVSAIIAQGQHKNLSFFAFTATPKDKTLQLFGCEASDGSFHPFHIYSMKQAIEEGFILDVLKHYMTYNMYYEIVKLIPDTDIELDSKAGIRAIKKYESLHPHNIAQKAAIVLNHFYYVTRHKIGGRAKAMLVTQSRLHAVLYKLELERQIEKNGFDMKVLVAFSGDVNHKGLTYTEEGMNKQPNGEIIRENGLPEAFHEDEFGMLVVAEKYQTGFDEPLLHTMFVDKELTGIKAVQTLSRLNRTMRGKKDTFVLDFVNTADSIRASFAPYYESTYLEEGTDPNVLYDVKITLDKYNVYTSQEIRDFSDIFFTADAKSGDLGRLQGTLQPALERYVALEEKEQKEFKSSLTHFNSMYAFITQVCRLFDKNLHQFSVYAKFLAMQLPKENNEVVDLTDELGMTYYRLEKEFEGAITLESSKGGLPSIKGTHGRGDKFKEKLEDLIARINERFKTDFTEQDKVFDQLMADFLNDQKWIQMAENNDPHVFRDMFDKVFTKKVHERKKANDEFMKNLLKSKDVLEQIRDMIGQEVYEIIRTRKQKRQVQDATMPDLLSVADEVKFERRTLDD